MPIVVDPVLLSVVVLVEVAVGPVGALVAVRPVVEGAFSDERVPSVASSCPEDAALALRASQWRGALQHTQPAFQGVFSVAPVIRVA